MQELNAAEIKKDFPILSSTKNGKQLIYLDSAATSQKPIHVIEGVSDYYKRYNANIHRGLYEISVKATEAYTESKEKVARLINAGSYKNIIYTKNATESINLVALSWAEANIKSGDSILITEMEHHSNIVPWQLLAKRKGANLEYAKLNHDSLEINIDDLKEKIEKKPKLVSFTHVSNVLGSINDAKYITELAHKAGAKVLVDGAQSVPHMPVDVNEIGCDFLAFSSHKMLGPAGIGVLYGKTELLEEMPPMFGGGDMIRSVDFQGSTWNELPWKFEAGTSNVEGAIGLGIAIDYLNNAGLNEIKKHEDKLSKYALKRLSEVKGIKSYGINADEMTSENKAGIVSFNINGAHPHDVAAIFDSEGIAIRAGHHCAMPLVNKIIGEPAVARASFYLYNTEEDVDKMVDAIGKVKKVLRLKE